MTNASNGFQQYQQPINQQPLYQAPAGKEPAMYPSSSSDQTAAVLAHLAGPIASFVSVGSLAVLGPGLLWLIYKDQSSFVRQQAAEAFNFQATLWIAALIGVVLCLTVILSPIGILVMVAAALMSVVMGIVAAVKTANEGSYVYPWRITILR